MLKRGNAKIVRLIFGNFFNWPNLTTRFRRRSLRNSVHKARPFPIVPSGMIRPGQTRLIASSGVMAFTITTVGIKQMQRFGNTISVWLRGQGMHIWWLKRGESPKRRVKSVKWTNSADIQCFSGVDEFRGIICDLLSKGYCVSVGKQGKKWKERKLWNELQTLQSGQRRQNQPVQGLRPKTV